MNEPEPPALTPPPAGDRAAPRWTWTLWTTLGGGAGLTAPLLAVAGLVLWADGAIPRSGPLNREMLLFSTALGWIPGGFGAARALTLRDRRGEAWPREACEFGGAFLAGTATAFAAFAGFALIAWMILAGAD